MNSSRCTKIGYVLALFTGVYMAPEPTNLSEPPERTEPTALIEQEAIATALEPPIAGTNTELLGAVLEGDTEVVTLLLEHGLNPGARTASGTLL